MKESFLHYVWRTMQFDMRQLKTTCQQEVNIIEIGTHNQYAGPDFLTSKIMIGREIWAGNVEIHIQSSMWNTHGHSGDPLYENVILHVVWEDDATIRRADGSIIPCLELKSITHKNTVAAYYRLMASPDWIPCASFYSHTSELVIKTWYQRLITEKLTSKLTNIDWMYEANQNDREQTFYQLLFRNFGFGVNNAFFEDMANRVSYKMLLKNSDQLMDIEAILFGTAGLLTPDNLPDDYTKALYGRFVHLRNKYGIIPKNAIELHFFKLRPPNFPTVRLAQLSAFLFGNQNIWSKVLAARDIRSISNMFDISVSPYWQTHYHFGKNTQRKSKRKLSKNAIHLLIINTIAPYMFHYGSKRNEEQWIFKSFEYLESIPAEKNHIITRWRKLGADPKSASESQALLYLKKMYCDKKRCLFCPVAHQWLNTVKESKLRNHVQPN